MASEVIWQPQAMSQLEEALDECEAMFGQQVTIDFYDRVRHYDVLLSANPHLGPYEPLLESLSEGLRSVVVHAHYKLIYHINNEDKISIVDMWNARREPELLKQNISRCL